MHNGRISAATLSLAPAALLTLALLASCASKPPPTADLSRAHTLVEQANQSGAARYASAELSSAQTKAQQADQKAKDDPELAARLANEASVDAELALARTRANKEQDALHQVNSSVDALRNQATTQPAQAPSATQAAPDQTAPPPQGASNGEPQGGSPP